MTKLRILQAGAISIALTGSFIAGHSMKGTAQYDAGYERALDDVANGEVIVESAFTRKRTDAVKEFAREVEYVRVVNAVAEAYHRDPSEVEVECGLVDERGEIKR